MDDLVLEVARTNAHLNEANDDRTIAHATYIKRQRDYDAAEGKVRIKYWGPLQKSFKLLQRETTDLLV